VEEYFREVVLAHRLHLGSLDRTQRNFEPMRKQVEAWQRSELSDVTAKVVIHEAFVDASSKLPSTSHETCTTFTSNPSTRRIAVGLENAFELSQEPLRPIASTTQAKIEHHASSGETVLPKIRLVILSSSLACLHIDWRFVGLNVTPTNQFSPHRRDHRDQQLADFEDPAV
jgi:hypothetical protein